MKIEKTKKVNLKAKNLNTKKLFSSPKQKTKNKINLKV